MSGDTIPPGWSRPRPERVPRPTAAPATLAFGITLFAWGLIASAALSLVGAIVTAAALAQWISELNDERSR